MQELKVIPKHVEVKNVSDTIALYRTLINVEGALNNVHLSHQQTTLLAYYALYGISKETEDLFSSNEQASSYQFVANLKTSIKKLGMILKNSITGELEVKKSLKIKLSDKLAIVLKIQTND